MTLRLRFALKSLYILLFTHFVDFVFAFFKGLYILIALVFYVDMNDPNPQKKKRRQQIQLNWGFYLSGVYSMIMAVGGVVCM